MEDMDVFPADDMGIRNPVIVVATDDFVFVGGRHACLFFFTTTVVTLPPFPIINKLVSRDFV
jgi:hypothetical protein